MKNLLSAVALLALFIAQAGCQKSTQEPPANLVHVVGTQPVGVALQSVSWSNTASEQYIYNADGTLKKTIGGMGNNLSHTRDFTYQNGRLAEVLKEGMKKEKIAYNALGQVASITEFMLGSEDHGLRLEFDYNPAGTLKNMKYFEYDNSKNELKAQTAYTYDSENQLLEATVTYAAKPQQQLVYTFSNYSDEVQFNPWALLDYWNILQPDYAYYNISLLSRLSRLPQKITRKLMVSNAVQETIVKDFNYTITGKQLQKIKYLNDGAEVTFQY